MGRYDDFNLNNGTYVSQYAGSPLDEVMKTNEQLEARHYKNINDLSMVDMALRQMKAKLGPGQRGYVDAKSKEIQDALKEFAVTGAEHGTAKVNTLSREFLGDEQLLRMNEAARKREEETKFAQELKLRHPDKNVIFKKDSDYYTQQTASPEHELFTRDYQPTAAVELNINDDMKKVIDEIPPDQWQSVGWTPETIDKVKNALKSNPKAVDGILQSVTTTTNKEKLRNLRDDIHNAFQNTASYKQQLDYSLSTPEELANKLDSYTNLKAFTKEDVQAMHNPDLDRELKRRQLAALDVPVAPMSFNNISGAVNVPAKTWEETEGQLKDLKTLRTNVVNNGTKPDGTPYTDEERQAVLASANNKISILEDNLASARKVIEKKLPLDNMWAAYKKQYDSLVDEYTKNSVAQPQGYQPLIGFGKNNSPAAVAKRNLESAQRLPQTKEEFLDVIRSNKFDYGQDRNGQYNVPLTQTLQKFAAQYAGRREEIHNDLKASKNYPVFNDEGNAGLKNINDQWTTLFNANSGFTNPITGDQVTPESIGKDLDKKGTEINGVKYVYDPKNTKVQVTGGMMDGKPVFHVLPALKPEKSTDGSQITYGESYLVTPDNQNQALMTQAAVAGHLTNPGNLKDRLQLIGQANFGPALAQMDVEHAQSDREVGSIGGHKIFVIPQGKDDTTNRNNNYILKSDDGTVLATGLRDLAQISAALGALLDQAQ